MRLLGVLVVVTWASPALAADPAWHPVATELLRREKTGFGGLCGIVVDHQSGEVWINLSDRGFFHSTDRGATWHRASAQQPKGRTETPGCFLLDPTHRGRGMVTALVYGSPIAVSNDRAVKWRFLDNKSSHIDWCAVDWTDPDMKFMLALKHESGGLLLTSRDGGKSFAEVAKGYGTGWIFDDHTAVVARLGGKDQSKPTLVRTTDAGRTFAACGDYNPVGKGSAQAMPKWRDGTLYWLVDAGLIATSDKGKTWKTIGAIKGPQYGPVFGKDAKHMFVLTKSGIVESTDSGATWSQPLVPPKELTGLSGLSWLEYDPKNHVLYLMKMGSDLYRLTR